MLVKIGYNALHSASAALNDLCDHIANIIARERCSNSQINESSMIWSHLSIPAVVLGPKSRRRWRENVILLKRLREDVVFIHQLDICTCQIIVIIKRLETTENYLFLSWIDMISNGAHNFRYVEDC